MKTESVIIAYGLVCIVFPIVFICHGFMTSRRHLCTAINGIMLGYIPFLGISSIAFSLEPGGVQHPYANYQDEYVYKMILSVILFTATMLVTYKQAKAPVTVSRFLEKQPPYSPWQPIVITIIGLVIAVLCTLPRFGLNIPVVSLILSRCMAPASVFAGTFAFSLWWKDRTSPVGILLLLTVFSFSVVLAVSIGGGRRALLGVLLGIAVIVYWKSWNLVSRSKMLTRVGILMLLGFFVINAYGSVRRHKFQRSAASQNILQKGFVKLQMLAGSLTEMQVLDAKLLSDIGQNTTNASLYSIHLAERSSGTNRGAGLHYPSYFHSALYVLVNPIPRAIWEDKPLSLGYLLAREKFPRAKVTWGPGFAGHFYHEGGLIAAVFYGVLIGMILKWFDLSIVASPGNLFLTACYAAMVPQLILLPRGDLGNALMNLVFCFATLAMIRYAAKKAGSLAGA